MAGNTFSLQDNINARAYAISAFPPFRQYLGNFPGAAGGTTRVKLRNVGITTRLIARINLNYTVATAVPTVSPKAPYNAITRVQLIDYNSTSRVNASAFALFLLSSARNRRPYGFNNAGATGAAGVVNAGPITALPTVGSGTGGAVQVGANVAAAYIEIPIAFDHASDWRGAMPTQTAVGEVYASFDWAASLTTAAMIGSDADAFFTAAGGGTISAIAGFSVDIWQEGYLPQVLPGSGNIQLPLYDLNTVYEIQGNTKYTDLSAGTERLLNYPNSRSVIGLHTFLQNQGASVLADSFSSMTAQSRYRLIVNGNNILQDWFFHDKLNEQRVWLDGDVKTGYNFFNHRNKPIETALFGNVQLGYTPQAFTPAATSYLEAVWESFYTLGSPLPGVGQG
jgi:hypothetical protein